MKTINKCTNCANQDRGEPNTWYKIVKFHDPKNPDPDGLCEICNGESVWGQ